MKFKRGMYNLIFGFANQIVTIILGIIIPKLFLLNFGSEVNGLMSSISQVFIYIGLLEAGIGGASMQALYEPIAKNDTNKINRVLAATHKYYQKSGVYYFIAVIVFAVAYPFFFSSSISKLTIGVIIFLTGMVGVISFFFQGKFRILLIAEGKGYVLTNIATIITILTSITKILLLILGFNVIAVQMAYVIMNIFQVSIIAYYIRKNYKWIDLKVKPNYEAISQKSSVLTHQIASLVFSNTDVLILTIFCGLKVVSVYVMYNMIFEMINTVLSTINGSLVFALGLTYHEDKNKYIKMYDSYELYYMAITFSLYTIAYILILPFMRLYTAGINDINYIDNLIPLLFVVLKLLSSARIPALNPINISGHFKATQNRAVIESVLNIIASLIFVQRFGIYGVLMGTIAALMYRTPDMIIYSNKHILGRSPWKSFKRLIIYGMTMIVNVFVINELNINSTSYIGLISLGAIFSAILVPEFIIVGSIFEIDVCKYTLNYIKVKNPFNKINI